MHHFVAIGEFKLELQSGNAQTEGQGQSPPKTIGILTKVFYIYSPNLVILAETGHELSRGQAKGWRTHTDTHTDRRRQRQYPKAKTGLG